MSTSSPSDPIVYDKFEYTAKIDRQATDYLIKFHQYLQTIEFKLNALGMGEHGVWKAHAKHYLRLSREVIRETAPLPATIIMGEGSFCDLLKTGKMVFPKCTEDGMEHVFHGYRDSERQDMVTEWNQLESILFLFLGILPSMQDFAGETKRAMSTALQNIEFGSEDFDTIDWKDIETLMTELMTELTGAISTRSGGTSKNERFAGWSAESYRALARYTAAHLTLVRSVNSPRLYMYLVPHRVCPAPIEAMK
jgi:hypothetical protein